MSLQHRIQRFQVLREVVLGSQLSRVVVGRKGRRCVAAGRVYADLIAGIRSVGPHPRFELGLNAACKDGLPSNFRKVSFSVN